MLDNQYTIKIYVVKLCGKQEVNVIVLEIYIKKKCERYTLKKWNSEKISTEIENEPVVNIKIDYIAIVKCVFTVQFNINCQEQLKSNWGYWWIMQLHHIGLPPATNNYQLYQFPAFI